VKTIPFFIISITSICSNLTYEQALVYTEWQAGSSVWPPRTAPGLATVFPWNKEANLSTAHIQQLVYTSVQLRWQNAGIVLFVRAWIIAIS
jgi:hypothetical protein